MRYTKKNNTYVYSPHNNLEVEIGDIKQSDFKPQVKFKKWENEANFSVRLLEDSKSSKIVQKNGIIHWIDDEKEISFYHLDSVEDGGYEFEITLKKVPKTNKITFSLMSKGVDFYYQPPLTEEEIANGDYRPENVIGSYAVYISDTNRPGEKYGCGKMAHIYRPRIEDSSGKSVWGILNISDNLMTVTIPQEFLNDAVYPVRHAAGATFGYSTAGASSGSTTNCAGSKYTMNAETGTLTSINCRCKAASGTISVYAALYSDSSGAPNALLAQQSSATGSVGTTASWVSVSMNSYSLANGGVYWLWEGGSASMTIYWDSGATNQYNVQGMGSPPTWSNPITPGTYNTRKLSIYATYTPDATSTVKQLAALGVG